jgi:SAM-dependent methyltransferase
VVSLSTEFTDSRLVAVYDAVNAYDPDTQPRFYRELARELGAETIVDLGCGTGLISCELAALGHRVIGVDPSRSMSDVGRRSPSGRQVHWVVGGSESIGHPEADLAIMSGHVAQFFLTDEAWKTALKHLHSALRPGGHLAFESRNPLVKAWYSWQKDASEIVDDPVSGPIEVVVVCTGETDGVVSYTIHYWFIASGMELKAAGQLRFRTADELTASLEASGFTVEHVYGNWDRSDVTDQSPELIFVARA